jgi:hypothetical protein
MGNIMPGTKFVVGAVGAAMTGACAFIFFLITSTQATASKEIQELKVRAAVAENDKKHTEETLDAHTQWLKSISADVKEINKKLDSRR